MTKEEFEAFQAKRRVASARPSNPVLDLLIATPCCPDFGLENVCNCGRLDADAVPAGAELELHNEIIRECRRRGWVYVHSNPTKKATNQPGTPDFIIAADGGRTLYVECKTKTGKLSKAQADFKRDIEALGHQFHLVRSMKQFLSVCHRGTERTEKT